MSIARKRLGLVAACLVLSAVEARAGDLSLRAGAYTDVDSFFVGIEYRTPVQGRLYVAPNFELVIPSEGSYFSFNADLHYVFPAQGKLSPWLGGGLGIYSRNHDGGGGDTTVGANLIEGSAPHLSRPRHPDAELHRKGDDASGTFPSAFRRTDEGDRLTFVAPVDPEVAAIHGDDAVARVELAHADEAEVREVGAPIGVSLREGRELRQVLPAVEGRGDQAILDHGENEGDAAEVKGGFSQHRLAGEEWLADLLRDPHCPLVVAIATVGEGDQEPGIGDALHGREKPFREDRSRVPRTTPASRMKA
jgi:hypothetical protein